MKLLLFALEDCSVCQKAEQILDREHVSFGLKMCSGPRAVPENLELLSYLGWKDEWPALYLLTDQDQIVQSYDGSTVKKGFIPVVRKLKQMLEGSS